MAVPEQTPYKEYTANGSTTSFALGFICDSKNDLIVLVDGVEPPVATWSLIGGNAVFTTAPASGKKIVLQRNTAMSRTTNYQGNNNSFRPETINKDIDRVWLKLQELGVADMLLKIYVDRLHGEQKDYIDNKDQLVRNIITDLRNYVNQQDGSLSSDINNLRTHVNQQDNSLAQSISNLRNHTNQIHSEQKNYIDQQDNQRNSYFENLISRQGVSLQQLDSYYNYLMRRIAQIAVDKGWDASLVADASGKSQQEINDQLAQIVEFYSIEKFTKPSDGGDASLMFKRAFDYAATKPYLIYFYAPKGQTYTLKTTTSTDPAVPNSKVILDLPGNVCFDGNGCTIKIANAFGNYMFMFRQTTYSDGGYFKNFTFDENHTNNPKTTNEATLDRRSVFSMWAPGSSLGSLEFERVIFKDVVGVHQITTSSYKKLSIKWCEVHSSSLEAPFIDRTAFYCGGDAEVLHNKFYSEGKNAVTCIELHNSNSTAMFNVSNGFRYGLFIVPEATLPRYNPIYQNVVAMYNNFENCLAGIKLWTYAAALPMKDVTVEHNTVTLNGYLNTENVVQAVDYGIGTLPNWTSPIDSLSVQHNIVRFIRHADDIASSVQHGYNFFALTAGAKYTLTNSNIRFNKCFDSPNSGFNWEFLSSSNLDSVLQNTEFSNNEIFNAGTSENGYGVRFLNVRKWDNFISKNNTATDDRNPRHTLAVLAVFGGFTEDNILGGFRSVGDKLNLLKITTPYIHYRADKAFPIKGFINGAEDYRITLKSSLKSEMLDEKTGYLYKKLSTATDDWATFADVASKPVKGWVHFGSTFNQIQPSAYAPSIFQIIQSGYLYKGDWVASTAYAVNDQVNAAGRVYKCTVSGTSGSTMPTSTTTEVDGAVTWIYLGSASITKNIGGRATGLTENSTPAQIVEALKIANLA